MAIGVRVTVIKREHKCVFLIGWDYQNITLEKYYLSKLYFHLKIITFGIISQFYSNYIASQATEIIAVQWK